MLFGLSVFYNFSLRDLHYFYHQLLFFNKILFKNMFIFLDKYFES